MTMLRALCLVLAATLAACRGASPAAPASKPASPRASTGSEQVVIDLFGTRQVSLERVLAAHGDELTALGVALMRNAPDLQSRTEAILAKLDALGDFADITLSPVGSFGADRGVLHLTLDFVDRADVSRRMPFSPSPAGEYPDPDGLLADWRTYEAKVGELMGAGRMSASRVDCPAYHCLGDHRLPEVAQLAGSFPARVPAHVDELAAILRDDRDGMNRAAAAFLLAYAKDGPGVVARLVPAFRDSSALVRNNALRVISDVALHHPEVEVPLEPVLEALDYPLTSDRNKAAAVLHGLLARTDAARLHRPIAVRAGETLLAMLRLQQPNNHNFAYLVLKAISGQDFGPRNYAAWEAWLRAQQAAQPRAVLDALELPQARRDVGVARIVADCLGARLEVIDGAAAAV